MIVVRNVGLIVERSNNCTQWAYIGYAEGTEHRRPRRPDKTGKRERVMGVGWIEECHGIFVRQLTEGGEEMSR